MNGPVGLYFFKATTYRIKLSMKFNKYVFITLGLTFSIFTCLRSEGMESDEYAGSESCIECHGDTYTHFKQNTHMTAADPLNSGAVKGCESCHGPGNSHVESGDIDDILSFGKRSLLSRDIRNRVCLKCHDNGKLTLWSGSEHDTRGLSCTDCHIIHKKNEIIPAGQREATPDDRCLKCHPDVKSQMMRQSHHPLREGKMSCADCHNPHGTISEHLIDAQQTNLKCFECHEEKRGPFLWEHPPVIEDCLTCHTAHGSTHSPLLKMKAPYLCQRCHSDQDHAGTLYAKGPDQPDQPVYKSGSSFLFYRACLNCHVSIHGSNHPSGKALLR